MIKLFEQFNSEQEIIDICKKYNIENYTINSDGSIDVDGSVDLSHRELAKLPLKFNKVGGNFTCSYNYLTTLDGCPKEVGGVFYCSSNNLTSLEGIPMRINGFLHCSNNKITTLKGFPMIIEGYLDIESNQISIIDSSVEVRGNIYIYGTNFDNKIKELSQERLRILFDHGVDYDIFRKDGSINDSRLERLFKDFNI